MRQLSLWIRRLVTAAATVTLLGGLASDSLAQSARTATALAAPVSATAGSVQVEVSKGILPGHVLVIDREALRVTAVSGLTLSVVRGVSGTGARPHGPGAVVWAGPPASYAQTEVAGPCAPAPTDLLPHIALPSARVSACTGGFWVDIGPALDRHVVTCRAVLATHQGARSCFTADRPYVLVAASLVVAAPETTDDDMTLMLTRQRGTEAPGSGDALLADGVVVEALTAQTVVALPLTDVLADRELAAGDRIGIAYADGTSTELAGTLITLTLAPR